MYVVQISLLLLLPLFFFLFQSKLARFRSVSAETDRNLASLGRSQRNSETNFHTHRNQLPKTFETNVRNYRNHRKHWNQVPWVVSDRYTVKPIRNGQNQRVLAKTVYLLLTTPWSPHCCQTYLCCGSLPSKESNRTCTSKMYSEKKMQIA